MKKVSVIVPIYNAENTLRRTLSSLTAQTFQNIEVIAVDDGSTDSSPAICDEYAEKDERFQVFHLENRGSAAARNSGIEKSSGDYIMFLDSDDEYEPSAVETMVVAAETSGADIVCGGIKRVKGGKVISVSNPQMGTRRVMEDDRREVIEKLCFGDNEALCSFATKIYKSSLIRQNSIGFPLIASGEDTVFALEAMIYAASILCIGNFPFYNYITSPGSLTQRSIGIEKRISYSADFLENMGAVLDKHGLGEMREALSARRVLSVYDFVMNSVSDRTLRGREKKAALEVICNDKYHTAELSGKYFKRYSFRVRLISKLVISKKISLLYAAASAICGVKKIRRSLSG